MQSYNFYINKKTNKLLRVENEYGKEIVKFTKREFIMLCNLLGCEKENYIKIGENT